MLGALDVQPTQFAAGPEYTREPRTHDSRGRKHASTRATLLARHPIGVPFCQVLLRAVRLRRGQLQNGGRLDRQCVEGEGFERPFVMIVNVLATIVSTRYYDYWY